MSVTHVPASRLGPALVAMSNRHLAYFRGPRLWVVLFAASAVLSAYVLSPGGASPLDARLMFASGWFAVVLGLVLASTASGRLDLALRRLQRRGVLTSEVSGGFVADLKDRSTEWAPLVGFGVGTAVAVMWVISGRLPDSDVSAVSFLALVWLAGFLVGFVLARLVAFGVFIRPEPPGEGPFVIEVEPGHVDGAAGLKPMGDYYLFQALLIAIPCVHLGVWVSLITTGVAPNLDRWLEPYIGLLVIAVAFEIGAAGIPLWSFHREMARQKRDLLLRADRLSSEISDLQEQMATGDLPREATLGEIASKTDRYNAIERMPTWPFDLSDWRKFALGNLALLTPIFIDALNSRVQDAL
jgi:hypothetical protein